MSYFVRDTFWTVVTVGSLWLMMHMSTTEKIYITAATPFEINFCETHTFKGLASNDPLFEDASYHLPADGVYTIVGYISLSTTTSYTASVAVYINGQRGLPLIGFNDAKTVVLNEHIYGRIGDKVTFGHVSNFPYKVYGQGICLTNVTKLELVIEKLNF